MAELDFEEMLMQYLGDSAWHTASSAYSKSSRKKLLKRVKKKIVKDIDMLDTTERHKTLLMRNMERFFKSFENCEPSWESIFSALMLISRFLGYDYTKGIKQHSLTYHQTSGQHYAQNHFAGGDVLQEHYDQKDIISERVNVVKELKEKGLTTLRISQILNTSENKIKQLIKL